MEQHMFGINIFSQFSFLKLLIYCIQRDVLYCGNFSAFRWFLWFFYEMKNCTWWLKILERHMNVIRKRHRKHRVCFPWRKLSNFSWSEYQIQETYHLSHGQRIGAHILMWTKDQVIKRGKERRSILETNLIERSEMGHYGKYQYTSMQFLLTSAN